MEDMRETLETAIDGVADIGTIAALAITGTPEMQKKALRFILGKAAAELPALREAFAEMRQHEREAMGEAPGKSLFDIWHNVEHG